MDPKSINQLVGKLAAERGRARERHVLAACGLRARPAWMRDVRPATRREDHRGIDIVIESDVGKLFVQVKSSLLGKSKFERRRRSARVVVVVVDAGDSLEAVLGMVVGAVGEVRQEYVRERRGAA